MSATESEELTHHGSIMYRYESFARKHLGLRNITGVHAKLLCPFHEEQDPSFNFNLTKGLYVCFACGAKGHIHTLAAHLGTKVIDSLIDEDELEALQIGRAHV